MLKFLNRLLVTVLVAAVPVCGQQSSSTSNGNGRDEKAVAEALQGWWTASMKTHDRRISWWRESEFGCFIHWGVYSTFGGEWKGKPFRGYAEHMMRSQKIPRAEYLEKVVSVFNPVKFDAEEWIRMIKAAGMKYVIITAKHHDGFAMYPSAVSRYNIRDATPFKRDPMSELAAAARKHGLRFGFYYSHAFDWEHPDAPGNDWDYDNPGGDKGLHGGVSWYDQHPELLAKARNYVDRKAIPQIVELIKNYQPDILWFDTPGKLPLSENLRIMKAVREASPNVVINGRLARGPGHSFGDYKNTGDRAAEIVPTEGDWETIPTTNESYGYHQHDKSHKPVSHFVQLMAKAAARGGNMLMNIGPRGDGTIDPIDQQILLGIGNWLAVNGKSIYATERTPIPVQPWGESTRRANTLYLHVFDWPGNGKLTVGGLMSDVKSAYLLQDPKRKPLKTARLNEKDIVIDVPLRAPDSVDAVVVLETSGSLQTDPIRLLASRGQTNVLRAFDGDLHGAGLRFGDGKAARAYAFEWRNPADWIGWKIRLNDPSEFEVLAKYTTASAANSGSYTVTVGDQVLKATVDPTPNENVSAIASLGRIKLNLGSYEIMIKPVDIQGGELMRLFDLELRPVGLSEPPRVSGWVLRSTHDSVRTTCVNGWALRSTHNSVRTACVSGSAVRSTHHSSPNESSAWKLKWNPDPSSKILGLGAFEGVEDDRSNSHPGVKHIYVDGANYRFDMHVIDRDGTDRQRNEVKGMRATGDNDLIIEKGQSWRYTYSMFIPRSLTATTGFTHVMQQKTVSDAGSSGGPIVTLSLHVHDGQPALELRLQTSDDAFNPEEFNPIPLSPLQDKWIDVEFEFTFDDAPRGSARMIVRDGSKVITDKTRTGIDLFRDNEGAHPRVRPKWGIYRSIKSTRLQDTYLLVTNMKAYQRD